MKILIIEDEIALQEVIKSSLEKEKFIIEQAVTYQQALEKIISYDYDCIILDIMLPDGNGLNVLKELKAMDKNNAVLILSAKDSIEDKVTGLDLGADDYLTKPFHLSELHARVKSILRRRQQEGKQTLQLGNIEVFPQDFKVLIGQVEVELNNKEFALLSYFMVNPDRLLTKVALAENIWGDYMDTADNYDFVYSQVKNLRKKLSQHRATVEIKSIYGMGYKLSLIAP